MFPPCSYSSTTAWLSLPCITVLSRRPIRGHGLWQLPHRPVSNLSLHPLCRHPPYYILKPGKVQDLFQNFFQLFCVFLSASVFAAFSKNPYGARVFLSPIMHALLPEFIHGSVRIISAVNVHAALRIILHPIQFLTNFRHPSRPFFIAFVQCMAFHSMLVYWYTSYPGFALAL